MKKYFSIVIFLGLISIINACGWNIDKVKRDNNEIVGNVEADDIQSAVIIKNEEFDFETDNRNYMSEPRIAVTKDGYYYFLEDYLYFYDRQLKESVLVCTQTICDHSTESCDAYFSMSDYRTEHGIWYYNNYLYILGSEHGLKQYVLYRFELDGTNREKVTDLFALEGEEEYIKSITIHRGKLLYSLNNYDNNGPVANKLFAVDIEKKKNEELCCTGIENSYIYRIKGYGDGVFYQVGEYRGEDYTEYHASVWYCDFEGQTMCIKDNVAMDYNIIDGELYYSTQSSIMKYNWCENVEEEFLHTGCYCYISYDNNYIYLDDFIGVVLDDKLNTADRRIYAVDKSGDVVKTWNIPLAESEICTFGDAYYLFLLKVTDEHGKRVWYAYPKEYITDETAEWERWN